LNYQPDHYIQNFTTTAKTIHCYLFINPNVENALNARTYPFTPCDIRSILEIKVAFASANLTAANIIPSVIDSIPDTTSSGLTDLPKLRTTTIRVMHIQNDADVAVPTPSAHSLLGAF
jgi:hypothetical protein